MRNKSERKDTMVFPYKVKFNGILYPVGADVPMDEVKVEKEVIKEEKAISNEVAESPAIVEEKAHTYNFTRSDIQKMHREELEPLAKEIGVRNTEGKRLIDIKKLTIEKLGI